MSFSKTVNLGNSIIGVSILAMPYCFVRSGLLLSMLLIVLSGLLTRLSCHFLLKSAFLSRRRSFELMVQDVLGSTGRILVELGLIGFLLGTCVAYFIMIGDLAPKILVELTDLKDDHKLRITTVILLSVFVALPLSLLRKIDSLTSLSVLSMILYSCLILKLMFETTDKITTDELTLERFNKISYWKISGLLTTFPIFSMAMSCQTSLFEIFDNSMTNSDLETIKRDNCIVKRAIYMCSLVYIIVGLSGYMAFHGQSLCGNILLAFHPSLTTTLTKFGFIVSLLLSFPLCLFPCRTSVYSLTFGKIHRNTNFQSLPTTATDMTSVETFKGADRGPAKVSKINHCDNSDKNNNNHGSNGSSSRTCLNKISSLEAPQFSSNHVKLNPIYINTSPYRKLMEDDDSDDDNQDCEKKSNGFANEGSARPVIKLYMSDFYFKLLTIILIAITATLSLLYPHIEFILGIIGSTAGTTVCFILPAYTFIRIGEYSKTELYLARLLLTIGTAMLIFCTYFTIQNAEIDLPSEQVVQPNVAKIKESLHT